MIRIQYTLEYALVNRLPHSPKQIISISQTPTKLGTINDMRHARVFVSLICCFGGEYGQVLSRKFRSCCRVSVSWDLMGSEDLRIRPCPTSPGSTQPVAAEPHPGTTWSQHNQQRTTIKPRPPFQWFRYPGCHGMLRDAMGCHRMPLAMKSHVEILCFCPQASTVGPPGIHPDLRSVLAELTKALLGIFVGQGDGRLAAAVVQH